MPKRIHDLDLITMKIKKYYVLWVGVLLMVPQWGYVQNFGSREHVMNRFATNSSILNYWEEQNPVLNQLFLTAETILSDSKNADYSDVIRDVTYQKIIRTNHIRILGGPMLGDVKSDGVSIWLRTALPASVSIRVMNASFQKVYGPQETSVSRDLTTVFRIEGLEPNRQYFYSLNVDGEMVSALEKYSFTTAPAEESADSVRIAFGSCPHRWGVCIWRINPFSQWG